MRPLRRILRPLMLLLTLLPASPPHAQTLPSGQAFQGPPAAPESDLALDVVRATTLFERNNRALSVARRAIDVAATEIRRADVAPNPVLSASIANSDAGRYRPRDTERIVRVEQTFERGGKRELRIAVANAGERIARLEYADLRRTQTALMFQTYYDLLGQQGAVGIARENADGYVRLVDAAERRLRAGDIASVDVARLRVEASRASADVGAARAALARAQIALAGLLGIEPDAARLRIVDEFPSGADDRASERSQRASAAIESRADVAAARARVEFAERAQRLAASQRTRDVTVGLQTERSPALGGNVFGVSAAIPLFINNDFSGDLARAIAERDQAGEDLLRIQAAVRSDIDQTSAALNAARIRLALLTESALPQARRAAQAIEFAFERGAATLTDLFDARRQFAAVRLDEINARADLAKALMASKQAVQLQTAP
jgi:cobalt-zinc-cadmium efflux system outer membrane protein